MPGLGRLSVLRSGDFFEEVVSSSAALPACAVEQVAVDLLQVDLMLNAV